MYPSYNDSFGSFAQPTADFSDGKKKKWWAIVGIVVLVAAIVAAIFAIVLNGGINKKLFSPRDEYLNYIANGETDNNDEIAAVFSGERISYLEKVVLSNNTEESSYFDKLTNLLNNIKDEIDSASYREQIEYLKMFKIYKAAESLSQKNAVDKGSFTEIDAAKNEITTQLNDLNGNMSTDLNSFKKDIDSYVQEFAKVMDFLLVNGCVSVWDGEKCIPSEELQLIMDESTAFLENAERYVSYSISEFLILVEGADDDEK